MYRLHVDATGEWAWLTIRCFWHVPDGKDPASSLVVDGYVDVPASVTSQPGSGCLTFEGSDGTKTVTSADLRYRVSANSGTEDGTMPEPGTPAWQQLVNAVHTVATTAEQAKTDAQTAAQQAGQALSDTITAKEDALKAIGDKQTSATTAVESAQGKALDAVTDAKNTATQAVDTVQANAIQQMELTKTDALKAIGDKQTAATQAVDTARDKAIKQVEAPTKAAQTAAREAATSAGDANQSAQEAADSLQALKDGIAAGDFKGEKGDPGPAVALDTTLTHEGEAADAKATGDAISAVKARQNILVGSEIGNPISVDDAFPAPLCGLTVYGKSTQDGTPTPDAPVPIVSAGESGSVAVKVTGKNRMPPNLKVNDVVECFIKKNTPITLVFKGDLVSQGGNILFFDENNNQNWFGIDKGKAEHHIKYPVDLTKFQYLLSDMASENVCLTWNASSPDYEPYREQLLTLPTPTGLPGIPVTSGGNYTDSTGQQWVCDEINLERGVRVQRIASFVINAKNANNIFVTNEYTHVTVAVNARLATPQKTNRDIRFERCVFCEALPWSANAWASTVNCAGFVENDSVDLTIENSYLGTTEASTYDERKAALVKCFTNNPCRVVYRIATPIETLLTP